MGIEFKDEHLEKLCKTAQKSEDNERRIEQVEEDVRNLTEKNCALYEMAASVKVLSEGVVSIKKDVGEIKKEQGEMKTEIQDIKNNPMRTKALWFDTIGKLIITAVVSGVAAFILGQICPSIFS